MSKMWLLRHKKGRSSHNCCLYQFFKIYFENKILKNENFDHPEKNELFCLQTNLFVKNSFYMTIICHHFYFIVGGMFYKNREDCGVVSDCEELVGYLQGMMGWF